MSTRTIATAITLAAIGLTSLSATAGDHAISFQYRSHSPSYYADRYASCDTAWTSQVYVYSGDGCGIYGGYYDAPVVYVGRPTSRVAVFDEGYPTIYHRTYTRSACYTRPLWHATLRVHRSDGHCPGHYRRSVTSSRHSYWRSQPSIRVYGDDRGGSRYRHSGSYDRWRSSRHGRVSLDRHRGVRYPRSYPARNYSSHTRHRGSSTRIRIGR